MDKLDDIHDNDEHWYTPAEYERTYGVPATSLKEGLTNGTLYAPMFYNGQPYTRHALVKMWQTPVRSGTFAAGDGRWPMKIQFLCDRFLQYIAAATILTATTDEQHQELREAEARIIKALEHVIHRTLTTTEAEHAITTLLVHFNAMLPAGPKDAVKDNSRGHPFTAYPKSGWAGHRVCARRVDCHPGHSSEVGGGRLVSEVTAPFPSRPLFG